MGVLTVALSALVLLESSVGMVSAFDATFQCPSSGVAIVKVGNTVHGSNCSDVVAMLNNVLDVRCALHVRNSNCCS
jgi:hypothetical protein